MSLIDKLKKILNNVKSDRVVSNSLVSELSETITLLEKIIPKAEITTSLQIQNDEFKSQIISLKEKLNKKNKKHENLLSHAEELEPLFEKLKKQSIGRVKLLGLEKDTEENLIKRIKKSEYSKDVIELVSNIELKTIELFSSSTKNNKIKKIITIKDPKNFKSGV